MEEVLPGEMGRRNTQTSYWVVQWVMGAVHGGDLGRPTRDCAREDKVRLNLREILVLGGLFYFHGKDVFPPSLLNQTKPCDLGGLGRRWR